MAAKRAAMIRCLRVVGRMPRWLMVALIAVIIPLGTVVALNVAHPRVAQAASGYLLPFPGGWIGTVTEGNNSGDHTGVEAWAWNIDIPNGQPVVAARGGVVTQIKQDSNTSCYDPSCKGDSNYVVIDQGDGTQALYLGLQLNGVRVTLGERVSQGEAIAFPSTNSFTRVPGLEFMVEQYSSTNWYTQSVPVTFDDVPGGVPVTGDSYTSGNYTGGGSCLDAPILGSPNDGTTISNDAVNFSWGPASGCSLGAGDGYTFRINQSSDPNASSIVDTSIAASAPTYSHTFDSDGVYWWHVQTCASCTPGNPGAWASSSFTIDTIHPDVPQLQLPSDGISISNSTVTFTWSPSTSPEVSNYRLHVSTSSTIDGSGAPLLVDTVVNATSYTYTFAQDYSMLWWSVAAVNSSNQQSNFAPAERFAINTSVPGAPDSPALQSPANAAAQTTDLITYSWFPSDSPGVTAYVLHASINSIIDGPKAMLVVNTTVSGTTFTAPYYGSGVITWSVAAVNSSNEQSGFSLPRSVTIEFAVPGIQLENVNIEDWGVVTCNDNVLTLQAWVYSAADIENVDFRRDDPVTNQWIELGTYTAPDDHVGYTPVYDQEVDCSAIPLYWNQMWISAIDAAGSRSTVDFWIYRYPPAVAPSALTAQAASCDEADLSWTDNSGGQDGFNIYRDDELVGQVGAGTTTFQDTWLDEETSYSYTVTATSGTEESSPTGAVSVSTPACPPPPTVTFTEPVGDGGTAICPTNGAVTVQASVTSTIGISSVQFYRYDPVSESDIVLDTTAAAPYYGATIGCRGLVHGWNLVFVFAFDTDDNASFDFMWIFLPRPTAGPGQPGGGNCADLPHGC